MSRNRYFFLIALTLLVAVLVILIGRSPDSGDRELPERLLPGLAAVVNELDSLDLVAPGGEVTVSLRRDDERWRVAQRDGYEAEFAQVLDLLRALAEAGVAEAKTARPSWYGELGVQDLSEPDATGRRINFPDRDVASIIIGQTDPSGEGSYARRADEERSWLLDRVIEVPVDPVSWLEPGIMDIPSEEISEIIVRHPDGETVRLRVAEDDDRSVVLMGVPDGREPGPMFKRNALANGLRGLNLEDVRRFESPAPDEAVRVLFRTIDGLNFVADVFERDEAYWMHFTVSAENVPTAAEVESPDALGEEDESGLESGLQPDEGRRLADAVAIEARLSPWLFQIQERRYSDLTQRMDDLLEPLEEDQGTPE